MLQLDLARDVMVGGVEVHLGLGVPGEAAVAPADLHVAGHGLGVGPVAFSVHSASALAPPSWPRLRSRGTGSAVRQISSNRSALGSV